MKGKSSKFFISTVYIKLVALHINQYPFSFEKVGDSCSISLEEVFQI